MAKDTSIRVASGDKALVDRGCELSATIKKLQQELEEIKDRLRREAGLNLRVGINEVELEGRRGVVSVLYPRESYKIDDTRISELQQLLGDRFDDFVQTRTVYKATADYGVLLGDLPGAARSVVSSIVFAQSATPRVSFGKVTS